MNSSPARTPHQDQLLETHLVALLGDVDPGVIALLRQHLEWVEVAGGDTLMQQGDAGDSMYIAISGRLRAYVADDDGSQRLVREISRGQIVGEMSLYTDEPRSATVLAIRDSVLVKLPKAEFAGLLASSAQVSIALTRQIIKRLQGDQNRPALEKPVTIALLPITAGVDVPDFAARLEAQLSKIARVRVIDAAVIDRELQQAGIAESDGANADNNRRIALLLDAIEADTDYVLLLADATPTAWTQRCCRHCDELLLLADATQPPALHPIEEQVLMRRPPRTGAAEILVLLHPQELQSPRGTKAWLARRPLAGHIHLRPTLDRDMARLARLQSRTAVGLVLAGGGARGFAHLGILRALQERGIEVDCVGGTSIGSAMAVYAASDRPLDAVMANVRQTFSVNPTGDFNLFPLLSLIKGVRLRGILTRSAVDLLGFDANLEDLWKNCFCIATNYSKAAEQSLTHGNIVKSLLASIAIPGALPPVIHDGDLLCDGGTFNNFPVDVMRNQRGIGRVIGVDLSFHKPRRIELDAVPGSWALLRDRFRAKAKRRFRLPSLASYLMNVTVLYSTSRQRSAQKLTDVYFNPPLERVGMLEWNKFDQIVQQGHAHGVEVLDKLATP
jgi:NTE family protein